MKKPFVLSLLACSLGLAAAAGVTGCSSMPWDNKEDPTVVPVKPLLSDSYQSFLMNWDEKKKPVQCALIRSPAEWEQYMHPAPVMGGNKKFGPSNHFYETRQLLLVGRVIKAPDAAERPHVFTPLSTTMRAGVLQTNYLFREPKSNASYSIKEVMLLAIPKERFTTGTVRFVENDKAVCEFSR